MASINEFVTVAEFARAWGVTPQTVRRWCDAGSVECELSPSGRRVIHHSQLPADPLDDRGRQELAMAPARQRRR